MMHGCRYLVDLPYNYYDYSRLIVFAVVRAFVLRRRRRRQEENFKTKSTMKERVVPIMFEACYKRTHHERCY